VVGGEEQTTVDTHLRWNRRPPGTSAGERDRRDESKGETVI
jgi:hypothetical protein